MNRVNTAMTTALTTIATMTIMKQVVFVRLVCIWPAGGAVLDSCDSGFYTKPAPAWWQDGEHNVCSVGGVTDYCYGLS